MAAAARYLPKVPWHLHPGDRALQQHTSNSGQCSSGVQTEQAGRLIFDLSEGLLKKRPNRTTYQSMHGGRASIIVERSSLHLVVTEQTLIVQLPRKRMLNAGGAASLVDGNQWIDFGCSIAHPVEA